MSATPRDPEIEQLRHWWFSRVNELSDLGLQRRAWLDKTNRNPHWSYIEFVEKYPYDDQLQEARTRGWLSPDEFLILSELGQILSAHAAPGGNDYDNAGVLKDPAWHAVVEAAGRAKQQLLLITKDRHEREMLLGAV